MAVKLAIGTPVVTMSTSGYAEWETRRNDRGRRPHRRDRRPPRLPPPHLQRARRPAGRRARPPRRALLGPAGHLRLPRRPHPADPVGDQRPRPALPPPPRDRQALRHPGRGQRRQGHPRGGGRHPARRSSTSSAPPTTTAAPGPTTPSRALRASLSQPEPAYHGDFYDFEGFVVDPCAVQDHVPIWVGGRTLRSLRRAAALADGWCPFSVPPAQAEEWLRQVELPPQFDVVLPPAGRLDPIGAPERTLEILAATAAAGATIVSAGRPHDTLEEYLEYLEALAVVHASLDGT